MVFARSMQRRLSELGSFPVIDTCRFVYLNTKFASNWVKSVMVPLILHIVHLIDQHYRSSHAAQAHLISNDINSTDLRLKV